VAAVPSSTVDPVRPKVSIVEDNPGLRELLLHSLEASPSFQCLGVYPDAESALIGIPREQPDVVLMNIKLPAMNGIECTRNLRRLLPRLNIVMLTEHANNELIFEALKAGANGYLLRDQTTYQQIDAALKEVMAGGSPLTPEVARKVVAHFQKVEEAPGLDKLTAREREVLDCLAEGWLYKEIADRLGISLDTARKHLKNIYRKLQVSSRTEAVVRYLRANG
jgi:RNA polymerase sigma factor (sigma-70 family)